MEKTGFNYERCARIIEEAIDKIELDLEGLTVFTEAATGGFAATAALATAAAAERVYALAGTSTYGSVSDARAHTERLTNLVGDGSRLVFPEEKESEALGETDVLTNTGFVRPIDATVAEPLNSTAAVPLMYEPWEFREGDMDIEALWARDIPVMGTDESDPRVRTQEYLSSLAAKLALECDLEISQGVFVVVGGGQMAASASEGLRSLGGSVTRIDPSDIRPSEDGSSLIPKETLESLDAIMVVDHRTDKFVIGKNGILDPFWLSECAPGTVVIHICGLVDSAAMDETGLRFVPDEPAPRGSMSFTTSYIGPRPIVDLHAAGLSIGADLANLRKKGADLPTATNRVAKSPLAMDFSEEFKMQHGFYD